MEGGKYTRLHNKAKWRVLVLYPLAWIFISLPSASSLPPLPTSVSLSLSALSSTSSNRPLQAARNNNKNKNMLASVELTGSPLTLQKTNRNMLVFLRDNFSLKLPQGNGVEGTYFPSHTVQTPRLALAETAGLISMLTYSPRAKPQLAPCGREQELGLTWNRTAEKRNNSLELHSNSGLGFINTSNFICRPCSLCFTEVKTKQQAVGNPKTSAWSQLGIKCKRAFNLQYKSSR